MVYQTAKLFRPTLDMLPALRYWIDNRDRLDAEKGVLFLSSDHMRLARSAELSAIVLPRVGIETSAKLYPATRARSVKAILPSTIGGLMGGTSITPRLIMELVRSVPAFHLALGTDLASVVDSIISAGVVQMSEFLISVILCVRDGEKYLREALDSVANQGVSDLQVIVVDDGSTDDSAKIAGSHCIRPQILSQPALGLGAALNCGMQVARGRFLAFIDCDDVWPRGRLGAMLSDGANCRYRFRLWPLANTDESLNRSVRRCRRDLRVRC